MRLGSLLNWWCPIVGLVIRGFGGLAVRVMGRFPSISPNPFVVRSNGHLRHGREISGTIRTMRQTSCTRCGLDIEGSEREGWRDRGNNTHCGTFEGDGEFVYPPASAKHTTREVKWGKYGTGKRRSPITGRMVSYPKSWTVKGQARSKGRTANRAARRRGVR